MKIFDNDCYWNTYDRLEIAETFILQRLPLRIDHRELWLWMKTLAKSKASAEWKKPWEDFPILLTRVDLLWKGKADPSFCQCLNRNKKKMLQWWKRRQFNNDDFQKLKRNEGKMSEKTTSPLFLSQWKRKDLRRYLDYNILSRMPTDVGVQMSTAWMSLTYSMELIQWSNQIFLVEIT